MTAEPQLAAGVFEKIVERAPAALALVDQAGRIVLANRQAQLLFDFGPGQLRGRPLAAVIAGGLPASARTGGGRAENPSLVERRGLRRDGTSFPVEIAFSSIDDGDETLWLACFRDLSRHVESENSARTWEARYRWLLEETRDSVILTTPEGRVVDINPSGVELLGYSSRDDLLSLDLTADLCVQPEQRLQAMEQLSTHGALKDFELSLRRKDGRKVTVLESATAVWDDSGRVISYRSILRDITDQRELEEQLLQAQKMEAVGRLAGGVAHDFNNLVTVISGFSELLLNQLDDDSLRREVEEIKKAGERAATLTRQLLAFSRRQVLQPKVLNLNTVVSDMNKMLHRLIGEDIELGTTLDPELWLVRADPGQLEQVVANLVVNARDAMPWGGRLTLETCNARISRREADRERGFRPGEYVMLRVSDAGEGMSKATAARAFEPFFTTKERGKGTGLGLSTVYGIVKQSDGFIYIDSQPARGTTFRIYLPRAEEEVQEAAPAEAAVQPAPTGHETVLLVEDEDALREMVSMMLEAEGYRVLAAPQGREALRLVEQQSGPIALLLTDVIIPGMSGSDLAGRLKRRLPGIKVVFMSGYTDEAIARHGVLEPGTAFLQKPFSAQQLVHALRQALDQR